MRENDWEAAWQRVDDGVAGLLRTVSEKIILPSFRRIDPAAIIEKSPGELVTVVDRAAEHEVAKGLAKIFPDARIVGEEAASLSDDLLDDLDQGMVWIIDPIDGTGNFVKGQSPFGIIIALAMDGIVKAGWILDPMTGRMCTARHGHGAFINGAMVRAQPSREPLRVTLASQFMHPDQRARLDQATAAWATVLPIPRCAAEHYPRLCLGDYDIALFQRSLPWDHAAGCLFLEEAGGKVSRWDGSPYRFYDRQSGIIAAASPELLEIGLAELINWRTGLQPDCAMSLRAALL